jgi:hypothetical protein
MKGEKLGVIIAEGEAHPDASDHRVERRRGGDAGTGAAAEGGDSVRCCLRAGMRSDSGGGGSGGSIAGFGA